MSGTGEPGGFVGAKMLVIEHTEQAMQHWRLTGLDPASFEPLFALPDDELVRLGARRRIAFDAPGFPCRVSLEDAPVGAELLLLPYEHHPADSPYRASGPIFVRRGAVRRDLQPGEVPSYVSSRLISVRAYDAGAMMIAASVCEGSAVASALDEVFADPAVAYVHLHNAKRGCFSCSVSRVS